MGKKREMLDLQLNKITAVQTQGLRRQNIVLPWSVSFKERTVRAGSRLKKDLDTWE